MKINQKSITIFVIFLCLLAACKNQKKEENTTANEVTETSKELKKKSPCDSPKTVKELLACANTVGQVDSTWVTSGAIADKNSGCDNSWNAKDTVLNVTYKDSIVLWRVNEWKNTPKRYSGSWFTNYSAKAAGLTKKETLDLFALNPCPQDPNIYTTCVCSNGKQPIDSVIKYEEKVKIGSNQRLSFGVTGKNPFGKGGPVQWHILKPKTPRFRLLEQIRWE